MNMRNRTPHLKIYNDDIEGKRSTKMGDDSVSTQTLNLTLTRQFISKYISETKKMIWIVEKIKKSLTNSFGFVWILALPEHNFLCTLKPFTENAWVLSSWEKFPVCSAGPYFCVNNW